MKFLKGEAVPEWLARGQATFGCDVQVTEERDGHYIILPARKMEPDECILRAEKVPHFMRPTIIWTDPDGELPRIEVS